MKKSSLFEKRWFTHAFAGCIVVLFYMLISNFGMINGIISKIVTVTSPIIIGAVIAYILDPIVKFFEGFLGRISKREKLIHVISVALTFILFLILLSTLLVLIIPSLIETIAGILGNLSYYQKNINAILSMMEKYITGLDTSGAQKFINNILSNIVRYIPENMQRIVNVSIGMGVKIFNGIIGLILAIYFLLGKKSIQRSIAKFRHAVLSDAAYDKQTAFLIRCHNILIKFIGADIFDSLIIGVLNAIILWTLGLPYVLLVSVIVGVTNLFPTFGPMAGCILGSIVLLFKNPVDVLIFIGVTIVIQIFDGYILKPKLFGDVLGVPPVGILVTVILGGSMFGVVGIILAIPFAAIFTFVYNESIIPRLIRAKRLNLERKAKEEAGK